MSWYSSWKSAVLISAALVFSSLTGANLQAWSSRSDCSVLDVSTDAQLETLKNKVIREYARLAKEKGEFPSLTDLQTATQLSRSGLRGLFQSFEEIKTEAVEKFRRVFKTVQDKEVFSDRRYREMMRDLKQYNRFIITADIPDGELHEGFYKALKGYTKARDAALVIAPQNNETTFMTPELKNEHVAFRDVPLTDHIKIKTILVDAKRMPTARKLRQFAQNEGTFLFASPKRYLDWVPVGNIKYPRAVMTTGAITKPRYRSGGGQVKFADQTAETDHFVGAVVVELDTQGNFHFRQITAREDGSFIDLGRLYRPDGTSIRMAPEALVLGDWHSGQTDPDVVDNTNDIVKTLKPRVRVLHDVFNGLSINHHEVHRLVTRAVLAEEGKLNLEAELRVLADDLLEAAKASDEVVIVKSNHDEFLNRYLEEGRDRQEPENAKLGNKLWDVMSEGEDPLLAGVRMFWKGTDKQWEKIRWLQRDEDYPVGGVQLGNHGDLGANGGYPSMLTLASIYPKSVVGHNHTAAILGNVWRVGTSSLFRLHYNRGPSSWTHTHALVYEDGTVQLINIVNGAWHRAD